jgi:hypothetical protein
MAETALPSESIHMNLRVLLLFLSVAGGVLRAADFHRDLLPQLQRHCWDCHNARKAKGGVRLDGFTNLASIYRHPKLWETAVRQVEEGLMPPENRKPQPTQEERLTLSEGLRDLLDNPAPGSIPLDPGPKIAHRLSRSEYNHTVRDLLGVRLRPADDFPADGGGGGGFDNNASTLFVPPLLLEKYLLAADEVLAAAPAESLFRHPVTWYRSESAAAAQNLRDFARRAWRRPVSGPEMARLVEFHQRTCRNGADSRTATLAAAKAVLVSPNFLFRIEKDPPGKTPASIDDHALASRLSYFLWASMPDATLFALADAGRLSRPKVLEAQVMRMLADPKARALSEQFVGQWLGIRTLGSVAAPDPHKFPEFTPALREAMVTEPTEFFAGLLREDRSLLELLDSDYAWVNADLARHYGISGVNGQSFTRVSLPDRRRGGVTGMAAVLTQTSYPQRTSPVLRGKWLLEEVFGTPPPPPPPLVATLSPNDAKSEGLTFRQRLEKHRKDPNCAACHARLDPLGFALENFDPLGRWRTEVSGEAVDASGELPGGVVIVGPEALKKLLLERRQLFLRHLTEKMLAYALGRGVDYYDIPAVKQITETVAADGHRAPRLILEIVRSAPFRLRRGSGFQEGEGSPQ